MNRRTDAAVLAIVLATLIAGLALISWQTVEGARALLVPALDRKAESVASSIASLSSEAVGYGIPVDRFVGANAVLQNALDENAQFAAAALEDENGNIVASVQRSRFANTDAADEWRRVHAPVVGPDGEPAGRVEIAVPVDVAQTLVRDLWVDGLVLLVVAVLVALELTAFAFALPSAQRFRGLSLRLDAVRQGNLRLLPPVGGSGPIAAEIDAIDHRVNKLRARHARLALQAAEAGDAASTARLEAFAAAHNIGKGSEPAPVSLVAIRAPVFLFFFAEEMTRPFLPHYIASVAHGASGTATQLVIAAPMVIFMAIVALSQPWLNGVTERFGRARALRAGALVAALGFAGTAFATTMTELIGFRAVTAIGFAAVFVAAQGFIVDRTDSRQRARGIGLFVSAIMAAMLCGPPIGGIVSDRLGENTTFLVSAAMALAAYACAYVALPATAGQNAVRGRAVRLSDLATVLKRPLMATLLVGCALPAKMLLIGVCFYYLPLALQGQFEDSAIGRVLMLYGLAMLIVVPTISAFSDNARNRTPFVVGGALAAASAVGHLYLWPAPWGAAAMVAQIGIAQGISTTPQSALVGEIGRRIIPDLSEGGVYGVFRLVERLGTALGPLFVGALWTMWSAEVALVATAVIVAGGGLVFGLTAWLAGRSGTSVEVGEMT
ncbi:MFS transporter [Acuticoccus sp. MNP-M23]|uniref:MFS transporter n=1 Tax=Acuticoccus sp. MNP-M23 TaxID=3072793 RepID=UPI002815AF99|nr:MFS transporter [Acuticoccus sp. MNP-M23]WMS42983.1 MFS transporter [Acuticoccus sp. MNP-M23]